MDSRLTSGDRGFSRDDFEGTITDNKLAALLDDAALPSDITSATPLKPCMLKIQEEYLPTPPDSHTTSESTYASDKLTFDEDSNLTARQQCLEDSGCCGSPLSCQVSTSRFVSTPFQSSKSLFNLIWRDVGDGLSRVYPTHALPPLISPDLSISSEGLPGPREGFDYFIESDEGDEGQISTDKILQEIKRLCPNNAAQDRVAVLSDTERTRETDSSILRFDSGYGNDVNHQHKTTRHNLTRKHCLMPPESDTSLEDTDQEGKADLVSEQEATSSNVQPSHLNPGSAPLLLAADRKRLKDYNANTSNGFESGGNHCDAGVFPIVGAYAQAVPVSLTRTVILQAAHRLSKIYNITNATKASSLSAM